MMPDRTRSLQNYEDYTAPQRLEMQVGAQVIPVITKPGLADWRRLSPAASLLAEYALFPPDARALLVGSGHGAAAVILAQRLPRGELWIMDQNAIALEMTTATLQANRLPDVRIHWGTNLPDNQNGAFDAVAMEMPKGRKLAQRWLTMAWTALRPGGIFYLAGANDLGVQSVIRDAAGLFGQCVILDYQKSHRVARFTRPAGTPADPPAWLYEPGISPGTWIELEVETPTSTLQLLSLPGVFSCDRLDDATRLLLGQIDVSPDDRVADLGCGYGVLGLFAARMGAAQVDLLDANLLAVAAAGENIRRLGLGNARALPSDVLSAVRQQTYTRILTNPPFHAGKGVDYQIAAEFIRQSWAALEPGGELLLVANRFIRYEKMMTGIFHEVAVKAEDGRYRVLKAVK